MKGRTSLFRSGRRKFNDFLLINAALDELSTVRVASHLLLFRTTKRGWGRSSDVGPACLLFVHGRSPRKTICQSINFYRRANTQVTVIRSGERSLLSKRNWIDVFMCRLQGGRVRVDTRVIAMVLPAAPTGENLPCGFRACSTSTKSYP